MDGFPEENPVASLVSNGLINENDIDDSTFTGPSATVHEVMECQLSNWYPTFSRMEGKRKTLTIPSIIVNELPADWKDYLLSDGVKLPLNANKLSSCADTGTDDWSSDGEEESQKEEEEEDQNEVCRFHFPQLNQEITDSIQALGGAAVPKLNWSAPKDATWVNGGSLKCKTPGDVYLLIKSSDFCLHDVLWNALKDCQDYQGEDTETPKLELILRKWCNFFPSMEFRCFVRQHELVAISQRNHTQHYPHLMQDLPRIRDQLLDFFEDHVRHRFSNGSISNYVVDVYLDQKQRVWILDFNIWARSTDSLLFEWSELVTLDLEDDPHFRIVETDNEVRQDPLASYRAPIDTVDLASLTGGDMTQFEEFMKQCEKPSQLNDNE